MNLMKCPKCGGTTFSTAEDFNSSQHKTIKLQCDNCKTFISQNIDTGAVRTIKEEK